VGEHVLSNETLTASPIEPFPDDYESPADFPGGPPVERPRAAAGEGDLTDQVRAAFSEGGVLSRAADHFREREGQTQMALAVAQTIDAGGVLVVEAGTGVGKTFSYLVPALLSGERVLLSTATKALQDQLFGRDLPRLVEALNLPVRTALLKGRASYLCLHRLGLAAPWRRSSSGPPRPVPATWPNCRASTSGRR
jgi:ATP-dependent DNA helicase DinG